MKTQKINSNPELLQKKRAKRKKKLKRIFSLIKVILLAALFVTTVVLLALSPLFNIKGVEVSGSKHYEDAEIVNACSFKIGENGFKAIGGNVRDILTLRYSSVEKKLLGSFAYIKSVKVRLAVPSKIKVQIIERIPLAVVPYYGTKLIIDDETYVLDSLDNVKERGLPVVEGLTFQGYKIGQALNIKNVQAIENTKQVMNLVKQSDAADGNNIYKRISKIDVSDLRNIHIFVDSRLDVNLGCLEDLSQTEANYRIDYLKQILMKLRKSESGNLDFAAGDRPILKPGKVK